MPTICDIDAVLENASTARCVISPKAATIAAGTGAGRFESKNHRPTAAARQNAATDATSAT